RWHDEEFATCAIADSEQRVIHLSFPTCSLSSEHDHRMVALLLLHEAVHFEGIKDESFCDSVALAIFNAWTKGLRSPFGQWSDFSLQGAFPTERDRHSANWDGRRLLIFGGSIGRFGEFATGGFSWNPETNETRQFSQTNEPS